MKNKLILLFLWMLKPWMRLSQGPRKHILIVSTTALGDTLWATPALESLRKSFPEAKLTVLTSPIGEEVLRHNPNIDHIVILKEPMLCRVFSLWRSLKKAQFQEIVIFHSSQRLILPLTTLLGATKIIGTWGINKGFDRLLTHPQPPSHQHEIVRRLELIEALGAKRHTEELTFFLQPDELLPKQKPSIALHPGSKDSFKRWPAEHFIQVGRALTNHQIIVTGTKEESALMTQVQEAIPGAVLQPIHSLRHFAAALSHMELLISNDTGPVHLASALQVPVIALYSPTDPHLCGPHKARRSVALAKPPTCTPCLKRKCRRPFCLLQMGPEEVIEQARALLYKSM